MAAEPVLTFAIEGILTKLTSFAAHEIRLAWGFKAELNRLRKTLSTMEGYLADVAQEPQGRSKSIEKWVTNLKRLAQDADDVLDEFNYELLRRKVEIRNHMKKKVLNFLSLSNPVAFRLKIAHKIQKINASLADLKSEASVIGLVSKKKDATPQRIRGRRETDSIPEKDEIVVGREKVVSNIVTTLTNSNINQENLAVMAIVGMAGLGKTTLAKSVYNDNSIKGYFDKKVWVCVSDPFDVKNILISMLESLSRSNVPRESQDALLIYLQEQLKGKKYLLVLDDVWNEDSEKWNELMTCLLKLESAQGSTIIVTTRSAKVASISEEKLPRQDLGILSVDECWSIMKNRAFSKCISCTTSELETIETIGREIAEKCAGVPLTAKVLGGILRSKKSIDEWSRVKDSRIWDLTTGENKIVSILKLSFDNLESPALKQCFAYCSMLIKDVEIKRDNLIQLWMAQGLLHSSPDRSKEMDDDKSNLEMEDIGSEYFDILLQSSLFQDARTDEYGIIGKCKMHDLVYDLAELVSRSESLTQDTSDYTLEIRHARVSTSMLERIQESSIGRLRSLLLNGELPGNMLPQFKALRVLKLFNANIEELPTSIGKLKHLRYLDISGTRIKRLPNSIGKLYNLQTLRATIRSLEEFPKDVQNLINLRHVYCNKATKFPVGVLGKLTSLRTLPPFYVDEEMGREMEELAALNQLKGELIIYNLEQVSNGDEARKAKLEEKKNVRWLEFVWSKDRSITNNNNDEDVLEGLQPHLKLESLVIKYFMGAKFPSWMRSRSSRFDNLKKIEISQFHKCEEVPALGHLPHLTVVWIDGMDNLKCVGAEFYGYDPIYHARKRALFPALKKLRIRNCKELIEWMEEPEQVMVFPCLEKLEIGYCPKLRKAPSHFPSLKKLKILDNKELTCVPKGMLLKIEGMEIRDCEKLTCIAPDVFGCCASLRKLVVENCPSLQSIPDLNLFTSLCELSIENCERLESLVSSGPISVVELSIIKCSGLQSIPALNLFTSLVELKIINAPNLESLPSLDNLTSLSELMIVRCGKLKYLPIGLHCCASLMRLELGRFWEKLDSFPDFHLGTGTGSSQLQRLVLWGWPKLKSLPQQIQHFTSLTSLIIINFDGVLEDWLGNLTSLTTLTIRYCKNLKSLPSVRAMQRLTKLQILQIRVCPLLKERCTKDSGLEWPKISHIPRIKIDDFLIADRWALGRTMNS